MLDFLEYAFDSQKTEIFLNISHSDRAKFIE